MAAAADFGPDSWLWPAFAGALPACRISHTEGPCLCEMQGAGSGAVEPSPFRDVLGLGQTGPMGSIAHSHMMAKPGELIARWAADDSS